MNAGRRLLWGLVSLAFWVCLVMATRGCQPPPAPAAPAPFPGRERAGAYPPIAGRWQLLCGDLTWSVSLTGDGHYRAVHEGTVWVGAWRLSHDGHLLIEEYPEQRSNQWESAVRWHLVPEDKYRVWREVSSTSKTRLVKPRP